MSSATVAAAAGAAKLEPKRFFPWDLAGGLLSITVNPETCKGCNLCVEVCPDGALISVGGPPKGPVTGITDDQWSTSPALSPDGSRVVYTVTDEVMAAIRRSNEDVGGRVIEIVESFEARSHQTTLMRKLCGSQNVLEKMVAALSNPGTSISPATRACGSSTAASNIGRKGPRSQLSKLIDDPASSGSFSVWGPLLAGTPTLAHEEVYWEAG
mgnify:CR=1 FL=1